MCFSLRKCLDAWKVGNQWVKDEGNIMGVAKLVSQVGVLLSWHPGNMKLRIFLKQIWNTLIIQYRWYCCLSECTFHPDAGINLSSDDLFSRCSQQGWNSLPEGEFCIFRVELWPQKFYRRRRAIIEFGLSDLSPWKGGGVMTFWQIVKRVHEASKF